MKQTTSTILACTLFIGLLLSVCYYYNYHEIVSLRPQSIHKWRQSDGASLALNYYQHQLGFFEPHTHNLTSDQGKSSACATSEVPVLYFAVAKLYQIFGYHDFIYRLFNTLIFLFGLIFLFRWYKLVLGNSFWAGIGTFFIFSSPVLVYYGNNFLSDSAALSFSIMTWYFYYRYIESTRMWNFYTSVILFMLAAFCKLTALINVFALLAYGCVLFIMKNNSKQQYVKVFGNTSGMIWLTSVPLMTFAWVGYASAYNNQHDCSYFSTTLFPMWDYSFPQILDLLKHMYVNWGRSYFHPLSLLFLGFAFVFGLFFFRRSEKMLLFIISFLGVQSFFIFVLQFWAFADHDYYAINLYILVVFIVLMFLKGIQQQYFQILHTWPVRIGALCFVLFNIHHSKGILKERYEGWANDYKDNYEYYGLGPFLKQQGISMEDTVISLPDKSHASLYLMNLKGWTQYTDARFNRGTPIKYNQDSIGIEKSISNGARYLFVRGYEEIKSRHYLHSFCTHLIAKKDELYIFDLRNKEKNFSIPKEVSLSHYLCDAERLNPEGLYFLSAADSMLFEFGKLQSREHVKNGTFSIGLHKEQPYGMTIRIQDTKAGEFIRMKVWRYDPMATHSGMIAAIPAKNIYYNKCEVTQKEGNWEQLEMQFKIDSAQSGEMLEMYLFNPDERKAYFDDFSIHRYMLK